MTMLLPPGNQSCVTVWREKSFEENPILEDKSFGTPIVTNA